MGKLYLESGWLSLNKAGEQLCGDHVETVDLEDSLIMVLADGLGSGVKASILSTLTAKILSTMLAGEMTVEDCVETIALTLPVCRERGIAYCTFTILRVEKYTGEVYLVQFDNPDLILLRKGKSRRQKVLRKGKSRKTPRKRMMQKQRIPWKGKERKMKTQKPV